MSCNLCVRFRWGQSIAAPFCGALGAALGSLAAANVLLAACQPVTAPPRPVVEETPTGEGVGSAETNLTTTAGLVAAMVEYAGPGGEMLPGYLARPEGEGPWPAVIVLQEWWGLNEHIMDVARRFANEGYVVLAPDLYKGQVATEPDEARKLVMALDMAAAVAEIQSGVAYLLEQEFVAGEQAGVIGFCMGGRLALATALADAGVGQVGVTVPFYGSPLAPAEAAQVKSPVLGLYGAEDQGFRRQTSRPCRRRSLRQGSRTSSRSTPVRPTRFSTIPRELSPRGRGGCVAADAGVAGEVFAGVRMSHQGSK